MYRRVAGNPTAIFISIEDWNTQSTDMRRVIERAGFKLVSSGRTLSWSSDVFVRESR
jgi:hypothetical protein